MDKYNLDQLEETIYVAGQAGVGRGNVREQGHFPRYTLRCMMRMKEFGQTNIIWVIEVGGLKIAHLGDNGPITDQVRDTIGTVDILMLPADGDQHILKNSEAVDFLDALKPKIQIPMHYCLKELEKSGKCPGGLLPVSAPPRPNTKINNIEGNTITISKASLPKNSEYWVFQPSSLIRRSDNQ
jgi:hypothetical protein